MSTAIQISDDISVLNLPARKLTQLRNKGLNCVGDILKRLPLGYHNYETDLSKMNDDTEYLFSGTLKAIKNGDKAVMAEFLVSGEINKVTISFFGQAWALKNAKPGDIYTIGGKLTVRSYYGRKCAFMTMPEIFTPYKALGGVKTLTARYGKIPGMADTYYDGIVSSCLEAEVFEYLDEDFKRKYNLSDEETVFEKIHRPDSETDIHEGMRRHNFDTIASFLGEVWKDKKATRNYTGIVINNWELPGKYISELPYELTDDQKLVLADILNDFEHGFSVNALIQGDVGCGKTSVAVVLALSAISSGYQAVLSAPSVIVATQHYNDILSFCEKHGIQLMLLTSKDCQLNGEKISKAKALKAINDGSVQFLIGTHSVLSEKIEYPKLGIAIIDEEHKFGVNQKSVFDKYNCSKITMSATPIPRSIVSVLYGKSFELFEIKTLPAGRKPVITRIARKKDKIHEAILDELKAGHQAYIVCRMIDKSENEKFSDQENVNDVFAETKAYFEPLGYKVGLVHGKMKQSEVDEVIADFKSNEIQVLVSTTVVEVGVNVPNATVMNIRNYDCMGFAGLHQLRGRIGRSSLQSFCLLTPTEFKESGIKAKLTTVSDGAEISFLDLADRGGGTLLGTEQSGHDRPLELILQNPDLYEAACEYLGAE